MPPAQYADEDRPVNVHDAEVPASVRQAALALMGPGDALWRCPRLGAPRGPLSLLGLGHKDVVIEWWLVDAQGELVDVFWHE